MPRTRYGRALPPRSPHPGRRPSGQARRRRTSDARRGACSTHGVAHAHVARDDDVGGEAVNGCVEAEWALGFGHPITTDEAVGHFAPRFKNGKVRRACVEQHHHGGLALRLPLAEQELIASRAEPLDVPDRQIAISTGWLRIFPSEMRKSASFHVRLTVLRHPATEPMFR